MSSSRMQFLGHFRLPTDPSEPQSVTAAIHQIHGSRNRAWPPRWRQARSGSRVGGGAAPWFLVVDDSTTEPPDHAEQCGSHHDAECDERQCDDEHLVAADGRQRVRRCNSVGQEVHGHRRYPQAPRGPLQIAPEIPIMSSCPECTVRYSMLTLDQVPLPGAPEGAHRRGLHHQQDRRAVHP